MEKERYVQMEDLYIEKDYCEHCDERWLAAYYARFNLNHKALWQRSPVKYCPLCGEKLKQFKGWQDDRKDWW